MQINKTILLPQHQKIHAREQTSPGLHFKTMRGLEVIKNKHLIRSSGYLNGVFTSGQAKNTFDVVNPANGDLLAKLPRMTAVDAENGAKIANDAWGPWKVTPVAERSKILFKMSALMTKYQDDLASLISLEAGKPFSEAKGEVIYATSFYEFYGEEAKRVTGDILQSNAAGSNRRMLVTKQAVGPAALITPWNFPSAMITRKVGPALAAGCTVLIKPAEQTPLSALALCAIAEEAGVPPGVINCLTVSREDVEEVGLSLCHSKLLRKVSFTGSTAVGKWLMRESASTVKKVSSNFIIPSRILNITSVM
jgi:succinate-semialdehyde dehydrogenase / glutarate-semialdehyde dehydrogenase